MAGRPREFDMDEVLDAAVELFWRGGFEATTTRAVAARTGLTASSLYNAFGSKHALLTAAMDRYEAQITDALVSPLETSTCGIDAISDFVTGLGRWLASAGRGGCMFINLMAEDGGSTPEIADRTRAYRARMRKAFKRALQRDGGDASLADVRADLLIGLVLGLNIAARGGGGPAEVRRLVAGTLAQVNAWKSSSKR